ncbi:MAG: SDR family NAD(P)-dependent oxidoreductase [Thermomonas hydrothermalis]|uniref:SDR family NAD(P)-dependent oxidoreductase n=1 Tax=Thermomonas hydrothermalis TaxID=213588 RepID=UPI0023523EE3|nr:SDR family NAD(P)-dependent oxidoreductase [Thermomonas hydrothermalis]MCL6619308.1 SDR family NAD(P)-dependent oxidoreductase [Thermomonas hydrothermalis]
MIDLHGKVALVTGAGGGLGRAHALLLASRGAKVAVNDLGAGAETVAEEIRAAGGQAMAVTCAVDDAAAVQAMVAAIETQWGGVDLLINNAGILRDKSFAKMPLDDFRQVLDVHVMGAVHCTQAVWNGMRQRGYGRIVLTTSCSGLFGNFGQANYAAAKMALVGLMQTLGIEGAKYGIRVNCLAPLAATRMMQGILPEEQLAHFRPELVSPAVLALVAEDAPNRAILCAGAGSFELAFIGLTQGIHLGPTASAEAILARWAELADRHDSLLPEQGFDQARHELRKAGFSDAT